VIRCGVSRRSRDVTLAAVRRALKESGRDPTYIFKVGDGYRFVANVRKISASGNDNIVEDLAESPVEPAQSAELTIPVSRLSRHTLHIVLSSCLYGMLYAIALILETAYQFDRYGRRALQVAPAVFLGMTACSVVALATDRKFTTEGKRGGVILSILLLLLSAATLFVALTLFLPSVPITESNRQAYPAQAAYLKDISYFVLLAFCFLTLPFHFVVSMQRDLLQGKQNEVLALLTGNKLVALSLGTVFVRPWMLGALLLVLAALSLALTSNLLDHLKLGAYTNLFIQLVYARALVYFALGLECVIWYAKALNQVALKARQNANDIRAKQ
jgi:hypothetical protein